MPKSKCAYRRTQPNIKVRSQKRLTLTPKETCDYTGIGMSRTYDLLRSGEMPSIRTEGRFFIPKAALLKWLESAGGKVA